MLIVYKRNAGLLASLGMGLCQEEFEHPRARRSEGIIGLRAPHVRPNLGSGDDRSESGYGR
ncbi:jg11289, partial [Pararge aegeria aegeria]